MAPFVGQERQALVDALLTRLGVLQSGETVARVVVLEAETGAGKSRVVREFYDRLRRREADDGSPPYWPALDEPRRLLGPGTDPLPARKVIGPGTQGFVWPANSVPSFVWWALACQQFASGEAVKIAADFDEWVAVHGDALWWAWNTRAGNLEKVVRKRDDLLASAREALQEGEVEGAGRILTELGIPTVGLGWLLTQSGKVWNAAAERRRRNDALTRDVTAVSTRESKAQEIAGKLKEVARTDLPVVVVVEDAHLLGADLAELLTVLAEPDPTHPVLVVATAWPEGRLHPIWADWMARHSARGTAEVWPMDRLNTEDLGALLRAYAPNTDDTITREVVSRWTNPLALELLLTWSRVAQRIADNDGALTFTAQELADLPTDVVGMYEARWATLPSLLRQVLSATRATLPTGSGTGPFLRSVIAIAAVSANLVDVWGDVDSAVIDGQLGQGREFGWLTELDDAEAFTEAPLADIAFDRITAELGRRAPTTVIPALRTAVADKLAEGILHARGEGYTLRPRDRRLAIACDWILSLTDAGCVPEPDALAVTLARLDRADREAAVYNYRVAIALTRQALDCDVLPPDHPDTLSARSSLASWLGESGRVEEAITELRGLIHDRTKVLGADHPITLSTRGNLASYLRESGRADEAIAEFRDLLKDLTRVVGPNHPYTLSTRGNLASGSGDTGSPDQNIPALRALLEDFTRVLGPDHRETLVTLGNLAQSLGESGRVDDAVTELRALLGRRTRVLGPDHPDTLSTRANLASWLGECGRKDDAVNELRTVLNGFLRVLGPDHPDTLRARNNLAYWVDASGGRLDAVISELRTLLNDFDRVLGPDHPDTMSTRGNLAGRLGESGRVDDAVSELRALGADRTRVLGPDHPTTLRTRNNLARWLAASGRLDDAVTELRALLNDLTRALGPDNPTTLRTRGNLAVLLAASGRVNEAITGLRTLRDDSIRALGPDDPISVAVQELLASLETGGSGVGGDAPGG